MSSLKRILHYLLLLLVSPMLFSGCLVKIVWDQVEYFATEQSFSFYCEKEPYKYIDFPVGTAHESFLYAGILEDSDLFFVGAKVIEKEGGRREDLSVESLSFSFPASVSGKEGKYMMSEDNVDIRISGKDMTCTFVSGVFEVSRIDKCIGLNVPQEIASWSGSFNLIFLLVDNNGNQRRISIENGCYCVKAWYLIKEFPNNGQYVIDNFNGDIDNKASRRRDDTYYNRSHWGVNY